MATLSKLANMPLRERWLREELAQQVLLLQTMRMSGGGERWELERVHERITTLQGQISKLERGESGFPLQVAPDPVRRPLEKQAAPPDLAALWGEEDDLRAELTAVRGWLMLMCANRGSSHEQRRQLEERERELEEKMRARERRSPGGLGAEFPVADFTPPGWEPPPPKPADRPAFRQPERKPYREPERPRDWC